MLLVCLLVVLSSVVLCGTIGNRTCNTWYYIPTNQTNCVCVNSLVSDSLLCSERDDRVYLNINYCMSQTASGELLTGACRYGYQPNTSLIIHRVYTLLPENPDQLEKSQCRQYKRMGLLCGECIKGFGPSIYSFKTTFSCSNCSDVSIVMATLAYLTLELFPVTVIFLLIMIFRINVMVGPLLGYIVFCQVHIRNSQSFLPIKASILSHLGPEARFIYYIALTLSGIWSFEFLKVSNIIPPFCISDQLTDLHALWFEYILVIYTVFLVLVTYVCIELHSRGYRIIKLLWRPFHYLCIRNRIGWSSHESIVHAYATMMIFLFLRINVVFFDINRQIPLITNNETQILAHVLLNDPRIKSYSSEHMPYLLTSSIVMFLFSYCPAIILCLYPTKLYTRVAMHCFSARQRIALTAFADTFQGCFKDGLNGTRDYRITTGLFMLIYALWVTFHQMRFSSFFYWLLIIFVIFLSVLVSYTQPCKSWSMNASLSFHFMIISFLIVIFTTWMQSTYVLLSSVLANVFFSLVILPHILMILWASYKMFNCFRRKSYVIYNMSSYSS